MPTPGSYAIHYTHATDSDPACPNIPDETVAFSATDQGASPPTGPTGEGDVDGGLGCRSSSSACTFSFECTESEPSPAADGGDDGGDDGGADLSTIVTGATLTYSTTGATGTSSTVVTVAGRTTRCEYDVTIRPAPKE